MKKIFTLLFGMIITASVFAADHRPSVILNNYGSYMVIIDGHRFDNFGPTLNLGNLGFGMHSVRVLGNSGGFWGRPRVISAANFEVGYNDVVITVGRYGDVQVNSIRNRDWDRDGDRFHDRDDFHHRDFDRDHDRRWDRDRDYDYNR